MLSLDWVCCSGRQWTWARQARQRMNKVSDSRRLRWFTGKSISIRISVRAQRESYRFKFIMASITLAHNKYKRVTLKAPLIEHEHDKVLTSMLGASLGQWQRARMCSYASLLSIKSVGLILSYFLGVCMRRQPVGVEQCRKELRILTCCRKGIGLVAYASSMCKNVTWITIVFRFQFNTLSFTFPPYSYFLVQTWSQSYMSELLRITTT